DAVHRRARPEERDPLRRMAAQSRLPGERVQVLAAVRRGRDRRLNADAPRRARHGASTQQRAKSGATLPGTGSRGVPMRHALPSVAAVSALLLAATLGAGLPVTGTLAAAPATRAEAGLPFDAAVAAA